MIGVGDSDVEVFLVGRKRDAVRASQVFDEQLQARIVGRRPWRVRESFGDAIDAVKRQLLQWVLVALGREAVRRVGEVERTVGTINQVVRAAQALALVFLRQEGNFCAFYERLEPVYVALGVPGDGWAAAPVERHAVRAGLRPAVRFLSEKAGRVQENGNSARRRPFHDAVPRDVGEEQVARVNPNRPFRPLAAGTELLECRAGRNDGVEARVKALD